MISRSGQLTSLGIVEDLADIRNHLFQRLVLFILQLGIDSVERHGVLDNFIIVGELPLGLSALHRDRCCWTWIAHLGRKLDKRLSHGFAAIGQLS